MSGICFKTIWGWGKKGRNIDQMVWRPKAYKLVFVKAYKFKIFYVFKKNTHIIQFALKVYNSTVFIMLTIFGNYHHYAILEHFHHPQKKPHTL